MPPSSLLSRPPPSSTLFPYTTLPICHGLLQGLHRVVQLGSADHQRRSDPKRRRIVQTVEDDHAALQRFRGDEQDDVGICEFDPDEQRSEEHTSELQSHSDLVCRLLLYSPAHHPALPSFPTRRFRSATASSRASTAWSSWGLLITSGGAIRNVDGLFRL